MKRWKSITAIIATCGLGLMLGGCSQQMSIMAPPVPQKYQGNYVTNVRKGQAHSDVVTHLSGDLINEQSGAYTTAKSQKKRLAAAQSEIALHSMGPYTFKVSKTIKHGHKIRFKGHYVNKDMELPTYMTVAKKHYTNWFVIKGHRLIPTNELHKSYHGYLSKKMSTKKAVHILNRDKRSVTSEKSAIMKQYNKQNAKRSKTPSSQMRAGSLINRYVAD